MPATQVNPSLRRRLSAHARELLRTGLQETTHETETLHRLPLAQRLQGFSAQLRLLPSARNDGEDHALRVQLSVGVDGGVLLRYAMQQRADTELCVFHRVTSSDATTTTTTTSSCITSSWLTTELGSYVQLRTFLQTADDGAVACEVVMVLEALEAVDLVDVFRASAVAHEMAPLDAALPSHALFSASTDKNAYVFIVDREQGTPLGIAWAPSATVAASVPASAYSSRQLVVEDYTRHTGSVAAAPPPGIKTDVELLLASALRCFAQWSVVGQHRMMIVFDTIRGCQRLDGRSHDDQHEGVMDDEEEGISSWDVYERLRAVGHSHDKSTHIATEMHRLLCDAADPSEEIPWPLFCSFWVAMLADPFAVSDPGNEATVLMGCEQLFLEL